MKEKDIRSREIQDRYLALCESDAADLLAREAEFVEVECPACAAPERDLAFIKQGYRYDLCRRCGTLYLGRRPTEAMLMAFNDTSRSARYWAEEFYPQCAEKRRESVYRPRAEHVRQLEGAYGKQFHRLLDVGTGYGVFLEELARAFPGAEVKGVEPGAALAQVCREKGLDVFEGFVAEAKEFRGAFDFCSAFEVIEHVFSPRAFLEEVGAALRPGGVLFANTLGCEGLDIQIMWERHRNVYPANHINILSVRGLEALFERAGFKNIRITTPGRLDLDIVRSQMAPEAVPRFLRTVYARGEDLVGRFQRFLAENQLSSHVWVVAEKG